MMINSRLPSNFVNTLRSKSPRVYGDWILECEEFSDGHQVSSRIMRPYLCIFVPTSVTTAAWLCFTYSLSFGPGQIPCDTEGGGCTWDSWPSGGRGLTLTIHPQIPGWPMSVNCRNITRVFSEQTKKWDCYLNNLDTTFQIPRAAVSDLLTECLTESVQVSCSSNSSWPQCDSSPSVSHETLVICISVLHRTPVLAASCVTRPLPKTILCLLMRRVFCTFSAIALNYPVK